MGLFNRQRKVIKEIYGGAWGHLVAEHKIDVDTLSHDVRCVDKAGVVNGQPVTLLRVFRLSDVAKKGVTVTGWETFDQHADILFFEGYLDSKNQAFLERKGDRSCRV